MVTLRRMSDSIHLPDLPTADLAPPTHLSEVDNLRLALATERVRSLDLILADLVRQHGEALKERNERAKELDALGTDLRARYQLGDAKVDTATGAIVRG